jgi:ATP-binding cassette subfamily B protein
MILKKFPHYFQIEQTDCGAVCLKIILKHYNKECDLEYLRELTQVTRSGITLQDINNAAKVLRFKTNPIKATINGLKENVHLPCILHWEQDHFVILYKINKNKFYISDPGFGKLTLKEDEFSKLWTNLNHEGGIAIELKPKKGFNSIKLPIKKNNYLELKTFIKSVLIKQTNKIFWLFLLIGLSTIISYVFPQTIKSLFDKGYNTKDINILWTIFGFQLLLFFGQAIVNLIQNFIGVHFSTQVSIKMLTNLLQKTIKLPIYFFENRLYSDILQKIEEQSKIEQLLTKQLISTIFSLFLFVALAIRLLVYNVYLALGFIFLTLFSVFWMFVFYNKRKAIDYYSFKLISENKNHLIEMITGMVSIKISNAQYFKIDKWKSLQNKIYSLKVRSLILDNYQNYAMSFFKQLFILCITFLCSYWVISNKMSIGEMLSIGYIIGLISQPIENIILFVRSFQDSKLVYNRTQEIYKNEDENINLSDGDSSIVLNDISINSLNFKYYGGNQPYVLKNINTTIPNGKVTAIVGESGSGKTTLLKLLLSFYPITEGEILIGDVELLKLNHDWWRKQCGVVMQDGYIFSGTIGDNISMEGDNWDEGKLIEASRIACIYDFITSLPLGFKTKIGNAGSDLSGGQKQRIFIARAVYNNPHFLFFDEATSSLDAKNERVIMQNLQEVFKGKTVIIIAHRLSTVKNADNIIVLKEGQIVEKGNHHELVYNKAGYYNLVKNQLELGN